MTRPSPLDPLHDRAGAVSLPYGPDDARIRMVQTYGELGLEYAAVRRSAALFDWPHRETIEITGGDRLSFLNRMVTQELKGLGPGQVRRAFWLNRKGRIDADFTLVERGDTTLALVDALAADRAVRSLSDYVITEDVSITRSTARHHLALHGPRSLDLLHAAAGQPDAPIGAGESRTLEIAGFSVLAVRDDACGETGFELVLADAAVAAVYSRLLEFAHEHHEDPAARLAARDGGPRLRPAGWLAFNTARIEAGTPLYNIDFGPDSLPHETGVLHERVSFKKGCYLGQEIVARMESRGHSKRTVAALLCADPGPRPAGADAFDRPMPVSGGGVFASADSAESVGTVTSATLSPMLGASPICFAAIKPGHASPGATLWAEAEGIRLPATVRPSLRFLP